MKTNFTNVLPSRLDRSGNDGGEAAASYLSRVTGKALTACMAGGALSTFLAGLVLAAALLLVLLPSRASAMSSADAMVAQHNEVRIANGLSPLTVDPQLSDIAHQRALYLADSRRLDHEDGPKILGILDNAGHAYGSAGENIARNNYQDAVGEAMRAFMLSPGHRANILDPAYRYVGVGVAVDSAGIVYFAVVFTDD